MSFAQFTDQISLRSIDTTLIAICDYLLLAIAKKVYHINQDLYILSAAIGKVLFGQ